VAALSKTTKVVGIAYLVCASAFILLGAGNTWYEHGLRRMLQLWSPINGVNFTIILITLAPGLALLYWSEKLADRGK
jgi:hypothetical protein